ncbi:MAG: hypothetical protein ACE5HC_16910 [Candidatus Binatia bacterium]
MHEQQILDRRTWGAPVRPLPVRVTTGATVAADGPSVGDPAAVERLGG